MLDLVKQDINFFENPLWFTDRRLNSNFVWKSNQGYTFYARYKPPTKTDYVYLLCLLGESQERGWSLEISLTRSHIIKKCGYKKSKQAYDRLLEGLERWRYVGLSFKGNFYNGKNYQNISFGILDMWSIETKTNCLNIRFNKEWLLAIKNSEYYKFISLNTVVKLRSPLTIRLYEILIKSFQGRSTWKIDSIKLAKKIPLKEKYASDVVKKISPAINQICSKTDLKVVLELDKKKRGTIILTFKLKKISQQKNKVKLLAPSPVRHDDTIPKDLQEIIALIPPKLVQLVKDIILNTCKKKGKKYVIKAIEYTNAMKPTDYCAYLAQTLRQGYGEFFDLKAKKYAIAKKIGLDCFLKNKGTCGAIWDTHKDNKTSGCHWCKKFEGSRTGVWS